MQRKTARAFVLGGIAVLAVGVGLRLLRSAAAAMAPPDGDLLVRLKFYCGVFVGAAVASGFGMATVAARSAVTNLLPAGRRRAVVLAIVALALAVAMVGGGWLVLRADPLFVNWSQAIEQEIKAHEPP